MAATNGGKNKPQSEAVTIHGARVRVEGLDVVLELTGEDPVLYEEDAVNGKGKITRQAADRARYFVSLPEAIRREGIRLEALDYTDEQGEWQAHLTLKAWHSLPAAPKAANRPSMAVKSVSAWRATIAKVKASRK